MMISILNYLIESSVILTVLYLLYFFLFREYKNFLFNRSYLILSMVFALTIPMLNIPLFSIGTNQAATNIQQAIQLPMITIQDGGKEMESTGFDYNLIHILGILYLIGASTLLIRFLIRFTKIYSFIKSNQQKGLNKGAYTLIPTDGKIATCSFFNYLLWDNSQDYSEEESRLIMEHEETHIHHKHSYDILFAELLTIIFWFNPLVYLYRNSLSAVHEYIADQRAASLTSQTNYLSLLSLKTLKSFNLTLGNNFHQTQIFKRMNMLKREKRRSWWSRIALTTPAFAILFYVFACEQQGEQALVPQTSTGLPEGMTVVNLDEVSPKALDWFNQTLEEMKSEEGGDQKEIYTIALDKDKMQEFPVKGSNIKIRSIYVNKENDANEIYAVVEKSDDFVATDDIKIRKAPDDVFTVVEEQPQPENGLGEFYNYIAQNIKYPSKAREGGIEGRVFVEFIVEKDGSISNVSVPKGLSPELNEEAIRVVKNSPKWIPGKQRGQDVKVKMIIPIQFKLDNGDKSTSLNEVSEEEFGAPASNLDEMVVVGYGK